MATIEAAQLRRYYEAYPLMLNQLSQMSDDDCRKIVNEHQSGAKGGPPSVRAQALSIMLEQFLPPSFHRVNEGLVYVKSRPIAQMSPRAAAGMVAAAKKGYLSDTRIWMSIYREYPAIAATARKA